MTTITAELIHATADRLQAAGTKPTLAAVRQALGSGSFTTISEAMKTWRAQVQEEKALSLVQVPAALDERVEQLKKAVWEVAQQEADHRLKSEREDFVTQRQAMEEELAELKELLGIQDNDADAWKKEKQRLNDQLEEMRSARDDLLRETEQLRSDLSSLQEKQVRDEVALDKLREKSAHQEQRITELEANLATEMKKRGELEQKYEQALMDAQAARAKWSEQLSEISVLKNQLETATQEKAEFRELENRLRLENQKQALQLARTETYESLFAEEQKKCEALNKELAELRAVLSVEQEKRNR